MNRTAKNAGWIIGCKVVKALLMLAVTMLTARYLGTDGYGLLNYAGSVVTFAAPFMHLGLNSVAVYEIVSCPDKEGETLGTIIFLSFCSSLLCIIGVVSFAVVANSGEPVTIAVCALYSITLCFQALEMLQYWFHAKLLSKYSAIAMLAAYVAVSTAQILLVLAGKSVVWFAAAQSADCLVTTMILLACYRKLGTQALSVSMPRAKRLLAVGKYYILSDIMVTIYNNTDRIMLKLMRGDAETGIYSAAHTSALMTAFVFAAIMDSFRPTVFESKKNGKAAFEKALAELYSIIFYLSLFACFFVFAFAPLIIRLMYGADYGASIPVLRLLVWFTTFGYLGSVRDMWIIAEDRQHYLPRICFFGALSNFLLNAALIPTLGAMGAAAASLATQFFTNVATGRLIVAIRPNNAIMRRGLSPTTFMNAIRGLRAKQE